MYQSWESKCIDLITDPKTNNAMIYSCSNIRKGDGCSLFLCIDAAVDSVEIPRIEGDCFDLDDAGGDPELDYLHETRHVILCFQRPDLAVTYLR